VSLYYLLYLIVYALIPAW